MIDETSVRDKALKMQEYLHRYPGGYPDEQARHDLHRLADDVLLAGQHHAYIAEKVTCIKGHADILYSHRKHEKYASGHIDSASQVRTFISEDIQALTSWSQPKA